MKFAHNIFLIAKYHRGVEIAFWAFLFFLILSIPPNLKILKNEEIEIWSIELQAPNFLSLIAGGVLFVRLIYLLKALGEERKTVLCRFGQLLIPGYNFFTYLNIAQSASTYLRDIGLKLGFLGVSRRDLKLLKSGFPHSLNQPVDSTDFSPFIEQYPELFNANDQLSKLSAESRQQIIQDQSHANEGLDASKMVAAIIVTDETMPGAKKKMLVVIDSDPRLDSRGVEAMRTIGGVSVWQQLEVCVVLRHTAARMLGDADLKDSGSAKKFVSMVRENGGTVHVLPDAGTLAVIDPTELVENGIKELEFAAMTAQYDYVMRF